MKELHSLTESQTKARWHLLMNPGLGEVDAAQALIKAKYEVYRQWPIRGYFVDIALPKLRVVVELDDPNKFNAKSAKRQAKRQKAIESEGWGVVRIENYKAKYPNYVLSCVERKLTGASSINPS